MGLAFKTLINFIIGETLFITRNVHDFSVGIDQESEPVLIQRILIGFKAIGLLPP